MPVHQPPHGPPGLVIAEEDPRTPDVRRLLEHHLGWTHSITPSEFVFALDLGGLVDPAVTFFTARRHGDLVGVGALRRLSDDEAELKSMHTLASARRQGVAGAMVAHLLAAARATGFRRVSLETGTEEEFAPARRLYAAAGFRPCGPFASYEASPHNTFMTLRFEAAPAAGEGTVDAPHEDTGDLATGQLG